MRQGVANMNPLEVLEICREAIWVLIKVSAPIMIITLVIGLMISLFQALTQIQEMTLTFVPKMLVVFFALLFLMPFMLNTLKDFSESLSDRIINIGQSDLE
jgi:flagellar biosynthetic protein FliQ